MPWEKTMIDEAGLHTSQLRRVNHRRQGRRHWRGGRFQKAEYTVGMLVGGADKGQVVEGSKLDRVVPEVEDEDTADGVVVGMVDLMGLLVEGAGGGRVYRAKETFFFNFMIYFAFLI